MNRIALIGAGGHGKVVADIAEASGYTDVVFVDQAWPERQKNGRWPIVGTLDTSRQGQQFCTIGQNSRREFIFQEYRLSNSPILIHPSAILSATTHLGAGTVAMAGVIVNADTTVGCGVILNTGCSVDHDCNLGDFVHISPGARLAGGVKVGTRSWIGIGAVVKEGITIGKDVMVAAGAAVISDIEDDTKVGGVPARVI